MIGLSIYLKLDIDILMMFVLGAGLVVVGIILFSLGTQISLHKFGELVGEDLARKKSTIKIIIVALLIGIIVSISEPDLIVLAQQFTALPNKYFLIFPVAIGIALFLIIAIFRIILKWRFKKILFLSYGCILIIVCLAIEDIIPIAFDAGGVATGPITVPFFLALGAGISRKSKIKANEEDSFGLVSICSIGPILVVLLMGFFQTETEFSYGEITNSSFFVVCCTYFIEIGVSFGCLTIFLLLYDLVFLKLSFKALACLLVGLIFSYLGIVIFLTSSTVYFMPIGRALGEVVVHNFHLVPLLLIIFLLGITVVIAEPSVYILLNEIKQLTNHRISKKLILIFLAVGVGGSLVIMILRIYFDLSFTIIIISCYSIALILLIFTPNIFTSIAFDSGGVVAGSMCSSFLLPFCIGICEQINPDKIFANAFGVISLVAITPLITIQLLGIIDKKKRKYKS